MSVLFVVDVFSHLVVCRLFQRAKKMIPISIVPISKTELVTVMVVIKMTLSGPFSGSIPKKNVQNLKISICITFPLSLTLFLEGYDLVPMVKC